jgi:serine/threonine protein phosphatase 1
MLFKKNFNDICFMRTLVIGDIHGSYKSLKKGLKLADFNIDSDRIICLGDYINGWDEDLEVIQFLIELKGKAAISPIFLMGNHDFWFREMIQNDFNRFRDTEYIESQYSLWFNKGGGQTYKRYLSLSDEEIIFHKRHFFDHLKRYHLEDNKLFVHAGFNPKSGFKKTLEKDPNSLFWNRSLFEKAYKLDKHQSSDDNNGGTHYFDDFDRIYIGHTPTNNYGFKKPVKLCNVINLDQGCKTNGRLTIWVEAEDIYFQTKKRKLKTE